MNVIEKITPQIPEIVYSSYGTPKIPMQKDTTAALKDITDSILKTLHFFSYFIRIFFALYFAIAVI